jgi:hypothetical protein
MVDARFTVGCRRPFEEDERSAVVAHLNRLLEGSLLPPSLDERFLHGDWSEVTYGVWYGHRHWRPANLS